MHTLQQVTWSVHNSHVCLIPPICLHSPTLVYHLGSTKEQNYKLLNHWKKSGVKSCLSLSGSNFENPQTSRKSTKELLQGFSVVFFFFYPLRNIMFGKLQRQYQNKRLKYCTIIRIQQHHHVQEIGTKSTTTGMV